MKLLTNEILKQIPALYSTEKSGRDLIAVAKFFHPRSNWTWYATEGSYVCPKHSAFDCTECAKPWKEFIFFGLVCGEENEISYFSLTELTSIKDSWGLGVERDLNWIPMPLSEIEDERRKDHGLHL